MKFILMNLFSKTLLNCVCHQFEFDLVYVTKPRNYAGNKPPVHASSKIFSQNLDVFLFYFFIRSPKADWRHLSLVAITTSLFMIPWQVWLIIGGMINTFTLMI